MLAVLSCYDERHHNAMGNQPMKKEHDRYSLAKIMIMMFGISKITTDVVASDVPLDSISKRLSSPQNPV